MVSPPVTSRFVRRELVSSSGLVAEGGSWQRGIRGSPTSPCSKTMLGDNEDRQPAEESPADEKVSVIVPWISSNRSAVDLVMVLR